ncbi:uncharacterized protein K444DRAFT_363261 [Hyaloscypha bicolor E]|uniref:Cora-domain-containing protein n=1 Tax=Hyaloscypha bicolor E TaxID=1095630 RepID=A0A2J6TGP2_9HELO|nr:uncharacterized protein K444DRAFT_363261 [Hyaloscypha bicolor E]PMD62171.1 hypothetical protein K444DRAFT_363261 [Hyaloscypha bicolor E]
MVKLLRKLMSKLGDTAEAWERFRRKDIGYFIPDDDGVPSTSSFLKCSVNVVDNIFLDLKDILRKFRHLEQELCKDNSLMGLNAHFGHGNHEAQLCQQKSARHIQVLTVITIMYLPLALAANMFSTAPGVLPFTPNFGRFILSSVALSLLVLASIATLFRWRSWAEKLLHILPIGQFGRSSRKHWDVEHGQYGDTPNFGVMPCPLLEGPNRSAYSPLPMNHDSQRDHRGEYHGYIVWVRDFLSRALKRNKTTLSKTKLSGKFTPLIPRSSIRYFFTFSNVLNIFPRPGPDRGKERIHWTCVKLPNLPHFKFRLLMVFC